MFYALCDNVFLVMGYVGGCIYDFNSSKLYRINNLLTRQFDLVNHGKITDSSIDLELKPIFDKFLDLGILKFSTTPVNRSINEIKTKDTGCKFAWIEITNKCNLRCCHCYNESNAQCDISMSLHDYRVVIDSLLAIGVHKIQIIGGEPFFDGAVLKDMLEYTVGKFDDIEIFTNGTLITPSWVKYFAQHHIHIALSVYSYSEENHDKVTGIMGSWVKTNRTIAALREYGVPYRVCNILMKGVALGERNTDLYRLSTSRDVVRMSGRANFEMLTDDLIKKRLITKNSFRGKIKRHACGNLVAGHNCFRDKIYISADMKIFPCVMERRVQHGTVSTDAGIILDNSIRHLNKDKIEECSQCEYRYACFDCRPDSLQDNFLEKPWYCTYKPLLGEWENEDSFIRDLRKTWASSSIEIW